MSVEELKIINGGHDWPSTLSSWGNQDINANVELWNFLSKFDMTGLIVCNSTNQIDVDIDVVNSKSLIRIVDILSKETKITKNNPLLYIYDDGTVEKKMIFE